MARPRLGSRETVPHDDDFLLLFTGTVTRVGAVTVSFDVDRVWSGRVQRQMTMFLLPGLSDHSAKYFVTGTSYLVDAFDTGKRATSEGDEIREGMPIYSSSVCSDTGPLTLEPYQEIVRKLGAGRAPLPQSEHRDGECDRSVTTSQGRSMNACLFELRNRLRRD